MSKAYRLVFECPKSRHTINLQRKCSQTSLSQIEAMEIFGEEQIVCAAPACGWHGKASKTKLLRILPFDWVLSTATGGKPGFNQQRFLVRPAMVAPVDPASAEPKKDIGMALPASAPSEPNALLVHCLWRFRNRHTSGDKSWR